MRDDQFLDFIAQMGDYMRSNDRRSEQLNQRFEQMDNRLKQIDQRLEQTTNLLSNVVTVMHDGFERVTNQISQLTNRVDNLGTRVDFLTSRVEYLTGETSAIRQRLDATFDQAGRLTEETAGQQTRLRQLEVEEPSNAELHRRVLALEEQMRRAS
ncbi:MAG: hypothetical protein EOO57_17920 [Hymenobacter sp.]|nr:MAG: hypothetical protein EOO57_17920 [Hymenobacter sp.]